MTLPTEASFVLPFGYLDKKTSRVHREGTLRLPTQHDLIIAIKQAGEVSNPAYLEMLLLSRILVKLGDVPLSDTNRQDIVESLVLPDVDYLNRVYQNLAQGQESQDGVCPGCGRPYAEKKEASA